MSAKLKLTSLPEKSAAFIEPMECLAVAKLPDGAQWLYEIKLDGYRAEAVKSERGVILFSRSRKSFNKQFLLIVEALGDLPANSVIDGEVIALDESGRPDFNLLQNFRSEASRIHFFIFDLLIFQGRDLTRLPLCWLDELLIASSSSIATRQSRVSLRLPTEKEVEHYTEA